MTLRPDALSVAYAECVAALRHDPGMPLRPTLLEVCARLRRQQISVSLGFVAAVCHLRGFVLADA